jgi:predicted dehydrogenase
MAKIKYGILGCGKHALQSHAIPGKELEELELIAICDISSGQLEQFEKSYGKELAKYTDKNEFLSSGITAVLIATPDQFHYQDLVSVIGKGLHAFVEKPLAVTSQEVIGLEKLLKRTANLGLIVSSCHPRRYDPPFMWLKENLPGFLNELGNPIEFRFDFSYHKPSKDWKHTRGLLLDHVNHEIDLMNYLFSHAAFEAIKLTDSFDEYHVVGCRADNIRFNFTGTRRLESHEYLEYTIIRFDRGEIVLDAHQGIARINCHDINIAKEIKIQPTDYQARGKATMENFGKAINKIEKCYLSSKDLYLNTAMSVMLTKKKIWKYNGASN